MVYPIGIWYNANIIPRLASWYIYIWYIQIKGIASIGMFTYPISHGNMCTTTCCFNFRGAVRTTEDPHPLLGVQHRSVAVPGSWDIVSSDWLPSSSLTLLQGTSNGAGAREDQVTRSWKNIKSTGWTKHVRNLHDFVRLACFGSLDMLRTSSTTFGWKNNNPQSFSAAATI